MSTQVHAALDLVPSISGRPRADPLVAGPTPIDIDALVERVVHAQKAFQDWPEAHIDRLLQALAECVSAYAEELASASVQETGLGNVADKMLKNRFASLGVYHSLMGQVGYGRLEMDKGRKVTTLASPVGVVFGLVPVTNPISTFIFKVQICLKGRNAVILSLSRRALGVCTRLGRLVQNVLRAQDAPLTWSNGSWLRIAGPQPSRVWSTPLSPSFWQQAGQPWSTQLIAPASLPLASARVTHRC